MIEKVENFIGSQFTGTILCIVIALKEVRHGSTRSLLCEKFVKVEYCQHKHKPISTGDGLLPEPLGTPLRALMNSW